MVVARPTVTPTTSVAGKWTPTRMRVGAMRAGPTDAGSGDSVVGAAARGMMKHVDFGGYGDSPSRVGCDSGGTTALHWRASGR